MATFIRNIIKIQCSVCGKDLGSFVSGDIGEAPTILPAIFPKEVYTKETVITTADFNGSYAPFMCPECAAVHEEKSNDNNKDGA